MSRSDHERTLDIVTHTPEDWIQSELVKANSSGTKFPVTRFGDRPLCSSIGSSRRLTSSVATIVPQASLTALEDGSSSETDTFPTPKVIIDLDSDPDATVVEITFGDRLGALLDTANVYLDSSGKQNKFAITKVLLYVETVDHPGLLVDLVKIITDINVAVESGEFDTEGLLAKAKFHVNYKDRALIKPLQQVLANCLRYFLRRPTTEEASF
ncbi:ACT domain-containing protein ACR11-like [Mangifera indica]|uniref:ACT domain-containing protein ACR11-like n=1 Tax=Mangifera indica TaxID=29780 RepID=UPI001CFC0DCA|nr:ACT domain-containing protein ACR11-like [Mangifera indica]